MANNTYTPQQAINLVQGLAHGIPLDSVKANICDIINSDIWRSYPWSWTVTTLTPMNLLNGVQDYVYTGAFITVPTSVSTTSPSTNYGGTWPIALSPNGLSESGTTVTVTTNYAHNLPTGTSLNGIVATIAGAGVSGYNGSLTITSVTNSTTIVGTIATSGLAASGAPGTNNILRILKQRTARLDTSPAEYRELKLLNNLSPELTRQGGLDTITAASFYGSSNTVRLDLAASIGTGVIMQVQGEYQFMPTKITDANMNTALPFPDQYFNVFVEGVLWQIYRLSDDPRAGSGAMSINGSQSKTRQGQYAIYQQAMEQMKNIEDLGSGDEFMWPEEPLGVGRSFFPGLFGIS